MNAPQISLQLWSVREELAADPDGTLAKVAAAGFTCVEAFGFVDRVDVLAAAFARHGIMSPTAHAPLVSLVENPFDSSLEAVSTSQVFAAAATLGVEIVIDPFVAPERWTTSSDVEATASALNDAADEAARHGIAVGYHNHHQELDNVIDGRTALELLAELLDPRVVLEVDLYWAAAAGTDVVALIKRLGSRVVAVHVKDGTLSPTPKVDKVPTDQVPAGAGIVPLAEALDAAEHLRYAIVEFDHYVGDIWDGISAGHAFLDARSRIS